MARLWQGWQDTETHVAQLILDKVNKVYSSTRGEPVHAVHDFSVSINDGEFMALLGPSGCGKSSTLRMVVGLEEITGGEILFDGKRINEIDPQGRNVAMGFENYSLYPNLSVCENLRFPLEIAGLPEQRIRERVDTISELLDIKSILENKPASLSGGQQQRVSLGRALVREPAAFILDEVMSHVDAQLKFRMLDELARIHREVGCTTMYVTHDQLEALALADRIAVMHQAKLQQYGTPQDLFLRPANVFVAGFIGDPAMNLITCEVTENKLVFGAGAMELQLRAATSLAGRKLWFGCRPQHLHVAPTAQSLRARVKVREYLGERVIYSMQAGPCNFKVAAPADNDMHPGDQFGCSVAEENCLFFDIDSGERITGATHGKQ